MARTGQTRHRRVRRRKMDAQDILNYCLEKPGAWMDHPFGPIPDCVKVGRRLFAQLYPKPKDYKITLNCDRMTADFYRQLYPGTVIPGYHCPAVQKPYFNTIYLNGTVPDAVLRKMIDHAYEVVFRKHTRKEQEDILAGRMMGRTPAKEPPKREKETDNGKCSAV